MSAEVRVVVPESIQHDVHQVSCMDTPCLDADEIRSTTFGAPRRSAFTDRLHPLGRP
jgi:hypothetical protein